MQKSISYLKNIAISSGILVYHLFFVLNPSYCQKTPVSFKRFAVEDGLSSINAILHDSDGFVWFGGTHGLYRYDGNDYVIYNRILGDSTSLVSNNISTLFQDNKGIIWVGTTNMGVCKFVKETERFTALQKVNGMAITNILRDHLGFLWVATKGHGLFQFDDQDKFIWQHQKTSIDNSISNNDVFHIEEDNTGRIWVVTNSGSIDLYNREKQSFNSYQFNSKGYEAVRTGQMIYIDHQGYFWIGTEGDGLYFFDPKDKLFIHYNHKENVPTSISNNIITGIVERVPGELWISTDGGGLNLLKKPKREFIHYKNSIDNEKGLSNNSSYCLVVDKYMNLWLGMGDGVVNISEQKKINVYQPSITNEKASITFQVVVTLCLSENNHLWVGTGGGGLSDFNLQTKSFNHYRKNPNEPYSIGSDIILSLHEDKNNNIWAGTFMAGADLIFTESGEINNFKHIEDNNNSLINNHIFDIEEDYQGNIWFATQGGGLDKYDPQTKQFTHYQSQKDGKPGLSSNRIQCLYEDLNNKLWIGTYDGGLQMFDSQNEVFTSYGVDQESDYLLQNNPIHDICEDTDGNLWLGTGESGLCKLNPQNSDIVSYTVEHGLPSNSVYGVFEDRDAFIWICTNNGIARYHPKLNEFLTLDKEDGLPTSDFEAGSMCQSPLGELFFASKNGLISFYPEDIKKNTEDIDILITGFRVFNETLKPGDIVDKAIPLEKSITYTNNITLPHQLNNFTIEFASPGSLFPAKIRYKYILEGAGSRWIETDSKRRFATFSNLDPGDYTFKVTGANSSGIWSNKAVQLALTITPPFWKTIWAYLAYLLALSYLTFLFIKVNIKRNRLKSQLEIEKYKREKDNELYQLKIGFFTNVSHELRTPLTLIYGPLERLLDEVMLENRVRHQLMIMQGNIRRLLNLVNQLLDFRKFESGALKLRIQKTDFASYIDELVLSFQELSIQKGINFSIDYKSENSHLFIDRGKIEIMIFNLLSNAFKHTPMDGSVKLKAVTFVKNEMEWLRIDIIDSGEGIQEKNLDKIFEPFFQENDQSITNSGIGLAHTKNLVGMHNGQIEVKSKSGQGSCFTVQIPVSEQGYNSSEIVKITENNITSPILKSSASKIDEKRPRHDLPVLMIVEDHYQLNNFLVEGFNNFFQTLHCFDGEKAFEVATTKIPDIIISDIMMPKMDGVKLCRKLKEDARTSHIPIILLTGRSAEVHQLEGLENGADAYITKPFSFKILKARVNNLIKSREILRDLYQTQDIFQPNRIATNPYDERFLNSLIDLIEKDLSNSRLAVAELATGLFMSHSVLYRKLMALTGSTVNDFVKMYRLKKAKVLLRSTELSVIEISEMVGFSNPQYFSSSFKKEFLLTPTQYRNRVSISTTEEQQE